jgi:hypothetical protein
MDDTLVPSGSGEDVVPAEDVTTIGSESTRVSIIAW